MFQELLKEAVAQGFSEKIQETICGFLFYYSCSRKKTLLRRISWKFLEAFGHLFCRRPVVGTLRKKCPNTVFFLVRVFPHLDWIRRDTPYLSVFSPNAWKCRINSDQNNSEYGYFLCMLNHSQLFVMRCAIWYHLYNIKNAKNIHGAVLLLGNFTKSNTTPWVFFTFLNCTNGTKSSAFRSTFCRNVPRKMKWFRPGRE